MVTGNSYLRCFMYHRAAGSNVAKALQDNFGVVEGLMTTSTLTGDQMILDGPRKGDFVVHALVLPNIVPNFQLVLLRLIGFGYP